MTTELAVYVSDDVHKPELQLHVMPGHGACCLLFGWDVFAAHVDSGPPDVLGEMFAAALTQCGTVAFLDIPDRRLSGAGWLVEMRDSWLAIQSTLLDRLRRRHPPWIRATNDPEHARRIFNGNVSWSMQAQVAVVLKQKKQDKLPLLERRLVQDLVSARDVEIGSLRLPEEVAALALPGVDGDYLEVVTRERSTRDLVRTAVERECGKRAIPFSAREAPV
jgi:hypothetical protein